MEENGVNVLVAVQLDVASDSKYINVNRIASLRQAGAASHALCEYS